MRCSTIPSRLARVAADPSLVPALVEEALRYDAPVQIVFRNTARATRARRASRFRPARPVAVLLGSANRDERQLRRRRPLRRPAQPAGPPRLRLRQALLPGRVAGAARGARRARGAGAGAAAPRARRRPARLHRLVPGARARAAWRCAARPERGARRESPDRASGGRVRVRIAAGLPRSTLGNPARLHARRGSMPDRDRHPTRTVERRPPHSPPTSSARSTPTGAPATTSRPG